MGEGGGGGRGDGAGGAGTHPNGRPAAGVALRIDARGKDRAGLEVVLNRKRDPNGPKVEDRTDSAGNARFTVDTPNNLKELNIKASRLPLTQTVSPLPSSNSTFSQPFIEKCIIEVVRIDSIIIFHLSKL